MRFTHIQTRDDGGGHLSIKAENAAEVKDLSHVFELHDNNKPDQLIALAHAMQAGELHHTSKPEKRLWFQCESSLDHRFTEPYERTLNMVTGFEGSLVADIDLTPHIRQLLHTLAIEALALQGGHFSYRVFIQAEEWNGMDAATYADGSARDYVAELVGYRKSEPEYIQAKNGGMKPNPNYLKRHPAEPALGKEEIWDAVFAWWRATQASAAQLAMLDAHDRLTPHRGYRASGYPVCHISDTGLYMADDAGTIDWDGKGTKARFAKWEEFKAAK